MADQLVRQAPARASLTGFAARIALALGLVMGVVVGVALFGRVVVALAEHLGVLLTGGAVVVVLLFGISRMISRRPL